MCEGRVGLSITFNDTAPGELDLRSHHDYPWLPLWDFRQLLAVHFSWGRG